MVTAVRDFCKKIYQKNSLSNRKKLLFLSLIALLQYWLWQSKQMRWETPLPLIPHPLPLVSPFSSNAFYCYKYALIKSISHYSNNMYVKQFSKTAHFSDQKISNTWSKKASWKRTLINAHYFSEHLQKSIVFHQHIKSNPMWPINQLLNNDALCECFVPRKQFLFSG